MGKNTANTVSAKDICGHYQELMLYKGISGRSTGHSSLVLGQFEGPRSNRMVRANVFGANGPWFNPSSFQMFFLLGRDGKEKTDLQLFGACAIRYK